MVIERDVLVSGVRLHIAEVGSAGTQPVVLIPGQSMPWESYAKVLPLLAPHFHVFAIDVRGHGRSAHTTGAYTFATCGEDLVALLRDVVREPAICAGNSSGGIIAMYAAACCPELVSGLLLEDAPLFSTEWPRMRDDTWIWHLFVHLTNTLPDLAGFFSTLRIPTRPGKKLMHFPRPLAWVLGGAIRRRQRKNPGAPVDIGWLPLHIRLFIRGLSEYDVDFSKACVDGRMCDLNQAETLAGVRCPTILLRSSFFRDNEGRLVGAMDDADVAYAQKVLPSLMVEKVNKTHVIHIADPRYYVRLIKNLAHVQRR